MKEKIYPESGVELSPFISKHYDGILKLASFGYFPRTISKAIRDMNIRPEDHILDLGCGTGSNDYLMSGYMNENGSILGMDISSEMRARFQKRFRSDARVRFMDQRIDQPFQLRESYDKVLISFVIHGFPHEVRQVVIENAKKHLKSGGSFFILDLSEFDMASMPALHRKIFKTVECKYAFDFIERDWKTILTRHGFGDFREHFYMKRYMRLLEAVHV